MDEFLNTTINGLSSGGIYALGAIGLSLVYGILKLVNFAHGDFMTLGGYVAFAINVSAGAPLAVAVPRGDRGGRGPRAGPGVHDLGARCGAGARA